MEVSMKTISYLLAVGMLLVGIQSLARVEIDDQDEQTPAAECLVMHTPVLEKVSSQCTVEEKAPAHCFKVHKIQRTVDLYKIPAHSYRNCTVTDENGTRSCQGSECLTCPSKKSCAKVCDLK